MKTASKILLWSAVAYLMLANAVFSWRNPLANQMSVYRDFANVVTWQKVEKYQADKGEQQ